MQFRYIAPAATAAIALAISLTVSPARSQSDIAATLQAKIVAGANKLASSCADEIKDFCSKVTPGEGREILCIEAHEDKLSPKCLFDMHEAAKNMKVASDTFKEATSACRGDVEKFCGRTAAGQGRVMRCLLTNKTSVSQGCAAALQKLADFAGQ